MNGPLGFVQQTTSTNNPHASKNAGETQTELAADRRSQRIVETLDALREWFPAAFVTLSEPRRPPLKVGIHLDVVIRVRAPAIKPGEIADALRFYCGGLAYLRALVEGAPRPDLDGEPAGAVTTEEAADAKVKIEAIRARLGARRKAEDAPKPPVAESERGVRS